MYRFYLISRNFKHFLITVSLWLVCFFSNGQLSVKGVSLTRNVGGARFQYRIDSTGAGVSCSFLWKDSLAGLVHLDKSNTSAIFSFDNNQQKVGTCLLTIKFPDTLSEVIQLATRIHVNALSQQDTAQNYTVLLAAWLAQKTDNSPPADSIIYMLTPVLSVVIKPIGTAKNNASVTIYSGSVMVYTVTLTQASPFVTSQADIILGDVKIIQGMQLTLQIPSSLQQGSIQMKATYSSLNIPPTSINALVAFWNL